MSHPRDQALPFCFCPMFGAGSLPSLPVPSSSPVWHPAYTANSFVQLHTIINACSAYSRTQVEESGPVERFMLDNPSCWGFTLLAVMCMCRATLCYAMLCYAMLCYAMLCYAMLCYAMLCYAMLCYAMLCYAMLCHAMLCHAMLSHIMQRLQYHAQCLQYHAMPLHAHTKPVYPCHIRQVAIGVTRMRIWLLPGCQSTGACQAAGSAA